jgi:hypothetical protein
MPGWKGAQSHSERTQPHFTMLRSRQQVPDASSGRLLAALAEGRDRQGRGSALPVSRRQQPRSRPGRSCIATTSTLRTTCCKISSASTRGYYTGRCSCCNELVDRTCLPAAIPALHCSTEQWHERRCHPNCNWSRRASTAWLKLLAAGLLRFAHWSARMDSLVWRVATYSLPVLLVPLKRFLAEISLCQRACSTAKSAAGADSHR